MLWSKTAKRGKQLHDIKPAVEFVSNVKLNDIIGKPDGQELVVPKTFKYVPATVDILYYEPFNAWYSINKGRLANLSDYPGYHVLVNDDTLAMYGGNPIFVCRSYYMDAKKHGSLWAIVLSVDGHMRWLTDKVKTRHRAAVGAWYIHTVSVNFEKSLRLGAEAEFSHLIHG